MSISSSSDYVIKVYTSKANAQADSSALSITSYNTAQVSGHEDDQYFVGFTKYWYRVEFNEPVTGFYIDWDDGEDNSPEKSNSQIVYLDKPQHYGVVSHIYTKSGKFYPLVRAISMDGFWSKYYTNGNSNNTFGELDDRTVANIGTGNQDTSLLHLDDQSSPKIPLLYPTTLPPVAVLKTDRKTVYSGIFNGAVEGNLTARALPSMVYAWFSGETTTPSIGKDVPVELTYETLGGKIRTVTLHTKYDAADLGANPPGVYDVWRVLEAKLKYCTEAASANLAGSNMLYPGERVYLRVCHTSSIQSTNVPKLVTQLAPSGSITNKAFIEYTSTGTSIAHNQKILITDTDNFNGAFTATKEFTVSSIAQDGSRCTVTTSAPHGIPRDQVVTLADCGAFTGDQTTSSSGGTYDATRFNFLTSTTSVTAGGSSKATTKNGFVLDKSISSGMPAAEANTGGGGAFAADVDPVICSLSAGWPHHIFEDRGFFTTIDASESRTRASNLTIPESRSNLWLDRGDFSFKDQDTGLDYATDKLSAAENRMDTYRERHAYTHDPYVNGVFAGVRGVLDDRTVGGDNRFLDDYRLLRLQVKDDRTETAHDKFSYSKIENFNDYTQASNTSKHYPSDVEEWNYISETVNKGGAWDECETENDDSSNSLIDFASADVITGTPLNYTIMALHQILPRFKEENKLQKVQCVILTDGEAGQLTYHKEVQRHWEDEPYLGCGYVHRNTVLRDRKLGTTYTFNVNGWAQITDVLLRNLKDRFTDMNLIGIRLLSPRDGNPFIRAYHFTEDQEFDRLVKDWKKDKAFAIKTSGYDTYFGLSSAALANDDEFQVQEDATKAQIKRAFVKSLKNKKMNKKVLSEFVELVA